jgi:hypothetical protein
MDNSGGSSEDHNANRHVYSNNVLMMFQMGLEAKLVAFGKEFVYNLSMS